MISDELYSHLADRATTRQCHAVRPGTASNQRTTLKLFIGFCTKFRINYRTVSEDNVCVFLEYLAGIMRSPSTVSNYLGSLRTCFRKMGYDTTPFTHHKVKDALNALSVHIRHVPRGELSCIVTYLSHDQHGPSLVLAVVLSNYLGDSSTIPAVSRGAGGRPLPTGDVDTIPTESRTPARRHVDAGISTSGVNRDV